MSLFKRGNVWWFKFKYHGQEFRESSGSRSKTEARYAESLRRNSVREGQLKPKARSTKMLSVLADELIEAKKAYLSPKSAKIEELNWKHLKPSFGRLLLWDVSANDIARYQRDRQAAGASPKTINLEVGTLRAILRRHRVWADLQPDVTMLRTRDDVGKALTKEEERALLEQCRLSRSRSLYPAVETALNTCMRYSEIRLLRWGQVDLVVGDLTVGVSKTEAGDRRVIPLNARIMAVLGFWADLFPNRRSEHFVFPSELYGGGGKKGQFGFTRGCPYATDVTLPIGGWKEAWEFAKKQAKVSCRFHDLRHTGCSRMLEAGVPFSVVATIMGWSAGTTVRMAKRYGHIGHIARREAMEKLSTTTGIDTEGVQKWVQSQKSISRSVQ